MIKRTAYSVIMFWKINKQNIKIVIYTLLLFFVSCSEVVQTKLIINNGLTQGTTYNIRYISPNSNNIQHEIDSILKVIDLSLSTYIEKSLISQVNRNETDILDTLNQRVFETALNIAYITDGAFDPTIAPIVNFWGFGHKEINLKNKNTISELMESVGYKNVKINGNKIIKSHPKTTFDFNGIAQGFSVDVIAEHFNKKNINNYMIEIGGELKCNGKNLEGELWRIGIEKPEQEKNIDHYQAIINLNQRAVASSGNYRKYKIDKTSGEKYSHIINPKTGFPVKSNLLSVTIINPSCMEADALATACMIMGLNKSIDFIEKDSNSEALMVYSDEKGELKMYQSEGVKKMIIYSSN